jgi:hypothetical protein
MADIEPEAILELAESLGLPIAQEYRAAVAANFTRLLEQASLVTAVELPEQPGDQAEFEP